MIPEDLDQLRKLVGALRQPRQRRIHFTAESDTRRKTIPNVMGRTRTGYSEVVGRPLRVTARPEVHGRKPRIMPV